MEEIEIDDSFSVFNACLKELESVYTKHITTEMTKRVVIAFELGYMIDAHFCTNVGADFISVFKHRTMNNDSHHIDTVNITKNNTLLHRTVYRYNGTPFDVKISMYVYDPLTSYLNYKDWCLYYNKQWCIVMNDNDNSTCVYYDTNDVNTSIKYVLHATLLIIRDLVKMIEEEPLNNCNTSFIKLI